MGIVLKLWFSLAVLLAAISVWAFTIGRWGPWHERRAASCRLEVRGDTYGRHTLTSPLFTLGGGPATIRISAARSKTAPPAERGLIASVGWWFVPRKAPETTQIGSQMGGQQGLLSPNLDTGPIVLVDEHNENPQGRFWLRVHASSDATATVTVAVTEARDYWHGIPVFWIILVVGMVYVALNLWLLRRRRYPGTHNFLAPPREHHW